MAALILASHEEPPVLSDSRRRSGLLAAIAVSAAALGTALYASRVAPRNVEVEEVALPLRHMGSAFDDYRIVQISDLHADRWMTPSRLRTLVEMVNAVEPDLVVVTGDLVTDPEVGRDPALAGALGALEARDGCLAVLGNYDYVAGEEVVRDLIAAAGMCRCSAVPAPSYRPKLAIREP